MKQLSGSKEYNIEDIQKQFTAWRNRKTPGCLIPLELWKAAVRLTDRIPAYKVSKALSLNYNDLIKHIEQVKCSASDDALPVSPSFLELPSSPPSGNPHCVVEMENRHGDKMKMYFTANQSVDLVALGRAFLGVQL
ncbi:MAG: hypothetical protein OEM02_04280 [Desulfobulbaceae bacterium]|nr:hypothetical protein [Desulfobulbaceae bacterium]